MFSIVSQRLSSGQLCLEKETFRKVSWWWAAGMLSLPRGDDACLPGEPLSTSCAQIHLRSACTETPVGLQPLPGFPVTFPLTEKVESVTHATRQPRYMAPGSAVGCALRTGLLTALTAGLVGDNQGCFPCRWWVALFFVFFFPFCFSPINAPVFLFY